MAAFGLLLQSVALPAGAADGRLIASADICHAGGDPTTPEPPDRHSDHCQFCQLGGVALPVAAAATTALSEVAADPATAAAQVQAFGVARRAYASRAPPTVG